MFRPYLFICPPFGKGIGLICTFICSTTYARSTMRTHAIHSRSLARPPARHNARLSHHMRGGRRSIRASRSRADPPPAAIRARSSSSSLRGKRNGSSRRLRPVESRVARATKYCQLSGAVRCVVTGPSGRGYVRVKRTHLWHCATSRCESVSPLHFFALHKVHCSAATRGAPKGMRPNRPLPKWRIVSSACSSACGGRPLSFRSRRLRQPCCCVCPKTEETEVNRRERDR